MRCYIKEIKAMARWATTIVIAGIVFTGCRADILDGDQFASVYRGSVEWANEGTADAQIVNVGTRGNPFGIALLSNEIIKIKQALAAVNLAVANNTTFAVNVVDEVYTINVNAIPDWNQKWFSHGPHSDGWLESVIFRFVSKGTI